jgi:hypothetical protein
MMNGADVNGTFYSEKGLRFGGIPTSEFFMATSALEELRPGSQQEIIARAHWLLEWRDVVVQIAFLSVCSLLNHCSPLLPRRLRARVSRSYGFAISARFRLFLSCLARGIARCVTQRLLLRWCCFGGTDGYSLVAHWYSLSESSSVSSHRSLFL